MIVKNDNIMSTDYVSPFLRKHANMNWFNKEIMLLSSLLFQVSQLLGSFYFHFIQSYEQGEYFMRDKLLSFVLGEGVKTNLSLSLSLSWINNEPLVSNSISRPFTFTTHKKPHTLFLKNLC